MVKNLFCLWKKNQKKPGYSGRNVMYTRPKLNLHLKRSYEILRVVFSVGLVSTEIYSYQVSSRNGWTRCKIFRDTSLTLFLILLWTTEAEETCHVEDGSLYNNNLSVRRQEGDFQNDGYKISEHPKFDDSFTIF